MYSVNITDEVIPPKDWFTSLANFIPFSFSFHLFFPLVHFTFSELFSLPYLYSLSLVIIHIFLPLKHPILLSLPFPIDIFKLFFFPPYLSIHFLSSLYFHSLPPSSSTLLSLSHSMHLTHATLPLILKPHFRREKRLSSSNVSLP